MKRLSLLVAFFYSISVHALPDCPSDTSMRWNDCLGTFTYTDGGKYVGEWKDSKRHGYGTYTYTGGDKYVGEWKDGKSHGQGTATFADGDKYVGEWKDSKRHGQGTYTFANGKRVAGYFRNNEYIPDICEEMGLVKGTESFGNCVNNLIDDL